MALRFREQNRENQRYLPKLGEGDILEFIKFRLDEIKKNNLYRNLSYVSTPQNKYCIINGVNMLVMSSNSYLGLSDNEHVKQAAINAIKRYGVSAGGSRFSTGSYDVHRTLEQQIASFKGKPSAVLFNSGYMANIGVIPAICTEEFTIFCDERNHTSSHDACRLARGRTVYYKHSDINDLYQKVKDNQSKRGMIVTDSVFNMEGDIANLPDIVSIAKQFHLYTLVDDSHATGVIGETGRGIGEYFGLTKEIDLITGTFGKALASEGGFVAGDSIVCDYIRNTANTFRATTPNSPSSTAAAIKALEIVKAHPELVEKLRENVRYFVSGLHEIGFSRVNTKSAIISLIIGEECRAIKFSELLYNKGIYVPTILYPSVAKGQARLRFTLMATHDRDELDFVIRHIKSIRDSI